MEYKQECMIIKIITAVSFVAMIVVNVLANSLPINNITTREVSDLYANLFAPAPLTYAIWGLIYLLLALYTLYQMGLFHGNQVFNSDLVRYINILFSTSSVLNIIWIFLWHYQIIPASLIIMIIILICLAFINREFKLEQLTSREKLFIRLPFSIYFGWITVATIANAVTFFVSIGWKGLGISDAAWTVIVLLAGTAIGLAALLKNKDIEYGLVLVWAYIGIHIKHTSSGGFNNQYPAVILAVIVCIIIFLIGELYILINGMRKTNRLG
ncbi:MAG: tryptophan-rich sensory protein [Clostridiales bacterium]|nr:tryptophan-rich sensory protein [Clostridiales bacterium]